MGPTASFPLHVVAIPVLTALEPDMPAIPTRIPSSPRDG